MLLLTVVATILIGPIEDVVVGTRALIRDDTGRLVIGPVEDMLSELYQRFTWRLAGRIGLVALFAFCLNILYSCVENAAANPITLYSSLLAAITPTISSYYWAAALQLNSASISRRAGWAVFAFGGALIALFALLDGAIVAYVAAILVYSGVKDFLGPYFAIIPALLAAMCALLMVATLLCVISGATTSAATFVGGAALDFSRRYGLKGVMPTFSVGLALWIAVCAIIFITLLLSSFAVGLDGTFAVFTSMPNPPGLLGYFVVPQILGWTVGLLVSGFPQIVSRAASSAPREPASEVGWTHKMWPVAIAAPLFMIVFAVPIAQVRLVATRLDQYVASKQNFLPLKLDRNWTLVRIANQSVTLTQELELQEKEAQFLQRCCEGDPKRLSSFLHRSSRRDLCDAPAPGVIQSGVTVNSLLQQRSDTSALLLQGAKIERIYLDNTGATLASFNFTAADCLESKAGG